MTSSLRYFSARIRDRLGVLFALVVCFGTVASPSPVWPQDGESDGQQEAPDEGESVESPDEPQPIEVSERCEKLNQTDCPRFEVTKIDVDGLNWTKAYVVDREILFEEGEAATYAEVVESIRRIRNTHIFRKVEFELLPVDDERDAEPRPVRLEITVDERWTLRPIFALNRGGGTFRLTLGALDINFLGRYLGVGGRYERFGPTNSFLFWAYDPRFLGERLTVGVNAGTSNRIYTLYDDQGEFEGGFLMRRFDAGAYVSREWVWWLETSFGISFLMDTMSLDFISDDIAALQRDRGVPPDNRTLLFEVGGTVGRINEDNYVYDGQRFGMGLDVASSALGSTHDVIRFDVSGALFRELPLKSNFGVRAATGFASSELIEHRYFLGGLDAIRGFRHDRFRGEQYWLANAEYRIPSFDYRWFVLQHVAFIDVAHVSQDADGYFGLSGASVGLGVRIIIPKIDGFNARIDYAFPLYGRAPNPLSFGGGQFF
ncbi:MAG: BamA/TamA family outer membrane protein [Myxococcota bacterium]